MAVIYREEDADLAALEGRSVAVVGYGNQGRSWALNLRDSGVDVAVCVREDATRDRASEDGFDPRPVDAASELEVIDPLRQRVLDHLLDGPPQGPGAEGRVVALLGEQLLGLTRDLEPDPLALKLLAHPLDRSRGP